MFRWLVLALLLQLTACSASAPGAAPSGRFTIAVIPDTQYLFDADRGNSEVLAASLRWLVAHRREYGIVFTAVLGDMVENHRAEELAEAARVYRILDDAGMPYSVVAGNHDLSDSSRYDDQRGAEPYLTYFSAARRAGKPGFGGASDNGYNSYFVFEGGGRKWLLLALDWRVSPGSLAWAQGVIDAHPELPVILTSHELLASEGLSEYGRSLWDRLIARNDQIFLTINGHFWPPARRVLQNAAGHDVHLHLADYQDRYYGGSGMIRLYQFDLARGTVEVSTFSPWVMAQPPERRDGVLRRELALDDADNRFVEYIDFAQRFRGFPRRNVPGTVAYWRLDQGLRDLSGHGNDLVPVGAVAGDYFPGGAYLRTADDAPLNRLELEHGYTIEALVRLPADCCDDPDAWRGLFTRLGSGADAGKTGDDPREPLATLTVAPGGGFQWAVYPAEGNASLTNWSHEIRGGGDWIDVAVVNDGRHTVMYVDGAEMLRNPRGQSVGLASVGRPWLIGASHHQNQVPPDKIFRGWLLELRVVDRPLRPDELRGVTLRISK
jgi:Concanavalin A-like lectin/glucanases superfamily